MPRPDGPQAFRWRLVGPRLPSITETLRIGEASRAAVLRGAAVHGIHELPDHFHHHETPGEQTHAFYLPEDADQDGLIDHMLVFAESGLPERLIPVLAEGGELSLVRLGQWRLSPDWMGRRAPGALFGPARRWVTATAYVPALPLHRSARSGPRAARAPELQLAKEIGSRQLGVDLRRCLCDASVTRGAITVDAAAFTLRTSHQQPIAPTRGFGAFVEFAEPIWGPLVLGYGAHFGLGLFEPADDLPLA